MKGSKAERPASALTSGLEIWVAKKSSPAKCFEPYWPAYTGKLLFSLFNRLLDSLELIVENSFGSLVVIEDFCGWTWEGLAIENLLKCMDGWCWWGGILNICLPGKMVGMDVDGAGINLDLISSFFDLPIFLLFVEGVGRSVDLI